MPPELFVLRSRRRWARCARQRRRPVLDSAGVHAASRNPTAARTRYGFFHIGRLRPGATVRTGAGTARRAPCRERRAVSAVSLRRARDVHRRHAAAGGVDARACGDAVSALGRRRIRPADRRHQHREPVARAGAAPGARAGHAPRPWGAPIPCGAATAHRRPASRPCSAERLRLGSARPSCRPRRPGMDNLPNAAMSGMDAATFAFVDRGLGARGAADWTGAGDAAGGGHDQSGARRREPLRNQRTRDAALPPRPRGDAGGAVGRPADCGARCCSPASATCSTSTRVRRRRAWSPARSFRRPRAIPDAPAVVTLSIASSMRVRAMPGVEAAGVTSNIALSGFESPSTVVGRHGRADATTAAASPVRGRRDAGLLRGDGARASSAAAILPTAIATTRCGSRSWTNAWPRGSGRARIRSARASIVARPAPSPSSASSARSASRAWPARSTPSARPTFRTRRHRRCDGCGGSRSSSAADSAAVVARLSAPALVEIDPDLPALRRPDDGASARPGRLCRSASPRAWRALFAVVALFLSMLGIYGVLAHRGRAAGPRDRHSDGARQHRARHLPSRVQRRRGVDWRRADARTGRRDRAWRRR